MALIAITYFIFLKGLKGTPYYGDLKGLVEGREQLIVLGGFLFWVLFSYLFELIFKKSVLFFVIAVGTFGLALAFSGNDLVNFIGVPMAAYHSYEAWISSGAGASSFSMGILESKVPAEPMLLFISGGVMVATLLLSKKAKTVTETEISLSRQGETHEKFEPNLLSRSLVKGLSQLSEYFSPVVPKYVKEKINSRFQNSEVIMSKDQSLEAPAFDMIRACVNLMVAGILIALATSMKLPLSTTYVTFMVAMGSSLADRAWGSDSAVYRVAGVFNVIGGWFGTAIAAFFASALVVLLINLNPELVIPILLIITAVLLYNNFVVHKGRHNKAVEEDRLTKTESSSVQGVIVESAKNIANVVKRTNQIYENAVGGLATQKLSALKKSKKQVVKLTEEVDDLRDNIFFFIKNLDESSVEASGFYINILGYLQDITQSLELISKISYKHVNNNHKKLKFNQVKELREIYDKLEILFSDTQNAFNSGSFEEIGKIINEKKVVYDLVKEKIKSQVNRTRTEVSNPKNTALYFSILLETKDLINSIMNLLEEYHNAHDSSVPPATISVEDKKEE